MPCAPQPADEQRREEDVTTKAAPAAMSIAITARSPPAHPARVAPAASRPSATRSSPSARLPFTSTASPAAHDRARRARRAPPASATTCASTPPARGRVDDRRAAGADADDDVEPERRGALARPRGARRRDARRARACRRAPRSARAGGNVEVRERDQRRLHRRGVRVVGVVEDGHARRRSRAAPSASGRASRARARPRSRRTAARTPRCATAIAIAAFSAWCAPVQRHGEPLTAERERRPQPVVDRDVGRSGSRRRRDSPTVTTVATRRGRELAASRGRRRSTPRRRSPGSASSSSASTATTPSRPPRCSACASPTFVTTPVSGRAMSHRASRGRRRTAPPSR